jgi:mycothiol maleylpyruvate isomerase-like protein
MTDDRELAGLDPFALLDGEAERLDAFFSGLGESGWTRASRCAGWTVRDVLGAPHLW